MDPLYNVGIRSDNLCTLPQACSKAVLILSSVSLVVATLRLVLFMDIFSGNLIQLRESRKCKELRDLMTGKLILLACVRCRKCKELKDLTIAKLILLVRVHCSYICDFVFL